MLINSKIRPHATQRSEQGYILLTLLLVIAIMAIMAFTLVTTIKFDVKRDREEEMIHRGVQYSRAIKAYYKKFNRFPVSIENLENTNQQRFLRKRYKDPLSCSEGKCRDFKLLHFGEAKLAMGGAGGGLIQGANTLGSNGTLSDPNQSSAFGGNSSLGGNSSFGTSANSAFGQSRTPNSASTGSDVHG